MVVTVFLLDKDFEIQAVLNEKISWEYTKGINKATSISVTIPRDDLGEYSKANLTSIAKYIQIYSDGLYTIGGRITKRDIDDETINITALSEECKMEMVRCPVEYSRKYEGWDLADLVKDLNKGWYTQRLKSSSQWNSAISKANVDTTSMTNAMLLTKDTNGVYNQDGYAIYRFYSANIPNFNSWDRIRWAGDNIAQTSDGTIELISTTIQYRFGNTEETVGSWSDVVVGALPDTLGLDISTLTSPILEVRVNLHTDDLTSEDTEGNAIGSTPIIFALEVIGRTEPYIGVVNIPSSTGVTVSGLVASENTALEIVLSACDIAGWEFEVYNNEIYIAEHLGNNLTETFVFKNNENIAITELNDDDENLINVLVASGTGSGINRIEITLRDDVSIALYGEYPSTQSFDTSSVEELTTMAQEYLDEHKEVSFNWRVDTFDSFDSTITTNINTDEAFAFHRLFSNSTFTVPSANIAEQNLFFYNPIYTVGDTIRIVNPILKTMLDSRILEEKRSGSSSGIQVTLYLNKARDVLVSRVPKATAIPSLSSPISISARATPSAVVISVPSSNERHRWLETQIFMSETSPVTLEAPIKSERNSSFSITGLDSGKRYYFVARYVDNNQNYSALSDEVSCIPLDAGDFTSLLLTASTTVISKSARNVLQTENIVFTIKNVAIPIGSVEIVRSDGGLLTKLDNNTYSMDCTTVSLPTISVTASALYLGNNFTSSISIVIEKEITGSVHNFAGIDYVPLATPLDEELLKGDYFLWSGDTQATNDKILHPVDENALVKGEIYEYERTTTGMWEKTTNGDLVMTLFDSFADLDVDVESTVIGNAVIKKLVALEAFVKNLTAQNITVGPNATPTTKYFVSFNGVNSAVSIPYASALRPTAQLRVDVSAYMEDWGFTSPLPDKILSCSEIGGYYMELFDGNLQFGVYLNGDYKYTTFGYSTLDGGWHDFSGTFDGRYVKLYVDGILKDTYDYGSTIAITYGTNVPLLLGAEPSVANPEGELDTFFYGMIKGLKIYSKADGSNLVGSWAMLEGKDNIINDSVSTNHGTAIKTKWQAENKGFRFRAISNSSSFIEGDEVNSLFDVYYADNLVFKIDPRSGVISFGKHFAYDPVTETIQTPEGNIIIGSDGKLTAKNVKMETVTVKGLTVESGDFTGLLNTTTLETSKASGDGLLVVGTYSGVRNAVDIYEEGLSRGLLTGTWYTAGGIVNGKTVDRIKIGPMYNIYHRDTGWAPFIWTIYFSYTGRVFPVTLHCTDGSEYTLKYVREKRNSNNGTSYPAYPTFSDNIAVAKNEGTQPTPAYTAVDEEGESYTVPAQGIWSGQLYYPTLTDWRLPDPSTEQLLIKNLTGTAPSEANRVWRDENGFLRIV